MNAGVIPSWRSAARNPPPEAAGDPSPSTRLGMTLVIAVAAIAHFTYFALRYGSFYFPDSFTYLAPAGNLIHGLGFSNGTPLEPDTIRTPGYPLLLILFGLKTAPVIAFQHLLTIGLAAALYLSLIQRLRSRFVAMTAAILYALDVPTIHIANKLLTETVFTALLFVIFVLNVAPRSSAAKSIGIGLLLGLMVLVRPIAMFFFALMALRIPRRQLIAFVAASLVLPGAWAARNWIRTGVFTVSSIGNINLLTTRAAGALAIEDEGDDFRSDMTDEQHGLVEDADDWIQQKLHIPDAEELPVAVRATYYGPYAMKIIAQHPIAFSQLTVRGILVNLFDSDWDALDSVTLLYPTLLQDTVGLLPVVVFVFALIGAAALWRTDRELAIAIALTVAYFILISAGGEAEYRFRVPVMPQIAIAAAVGLDVVRRSVRGQ